MSALQDLVEEVSAKGASILLTIRKEGGEPFAIRFFGSVMAPQAGERRDCVMELSERVLHSGNNQTANLVLLELLRELAKGTPAAKEREAKRELVRAIIDRQLADPDFAKQRCGTTNLATLKRCILAEGHVAPHDGGDGDEP